MTKLSKDDIEAMSYNQIVKMAKERGINAYRKKKVYLVNKLLAMSSHASDDQDDSCTIVNETFGEITRSEIFETEEKRGEKVENRRSVLIYKSSGLVDDKIEIPDDERRSTFTVKQLDIVDKQNNVQVRTRQSALSEVSGSVDKRRSQRGGGQPEKNEDGLLCDLSPDIPNWAKRGGVEVNNETRRSTFLINPQDHFEKCDDFERSMTKGPVATPHTRRSTYRIKPAESVEQIGDFKESAGELHVEGTPTNTRRSTFIVKPTDGNGETEVPEDDRRSTFTVKSQSDTFDKQSTIPPNVVKKRRSLLNEKCTPVSNKPNGIATVIRQSLDPDNDTGVIDQQNNIPANVETRQSLIEQSGIGEETSSSRKKWRSSLNRSSTFILDSSSVVEENTSKSCVEEAPSFLKRTTRSGTFILDSPRQMRPSISQRSNQTFSTILEPLDETEELGATPVITAQVVPQASSSQGRSRHSLRARKSIIEDKENLAKTPKCDDPPMKYKAKTLSRSTTKVTSSTPPASLVKVSKHRPVIRTPMSLRKMPGGSEVKTPVTKSAVKQPVNSGLKYKMPNFSAIHKRQFEKMESLVDNKKRTAMRALNMFSPPNKISSKIPTLKASQEETVVTDSAASENKSKSRSKSFIPVAVTKTAVTNTQNRLSLASKLPPVSVENRREKERQAIKGVRANRRFLLQMQMRNIN